MEGTVNGHSDKYNERIQSICQRKRKHPETTSGEKNMKSVVIEIYVLIFILC